MKDILFLTVCAVIGGVDGWDDIEYFGQIHESWFRARGEFEQGIPSRDAIRRVMSKIIIHLSYNKPSLRGFAICVFHYFRMKRRSKVEWNAKRKWLGDERSVFR